jgi:ABC-type iron transport system FetAB permease component
MMTGAILGGSSVEQAAKLQLVILFMLSSATTLASVMTIVVAVLVAVDGDHRIREDRIYKGPHTFWIVWSEVAGRTIRVLLMKIRSLTMKLSVQRAEQLIPLTRRS